MEPSTTIIRALALFCVGAIAGLFAFTSSARWPLAEIIFLGAFAAGLVMLALGGLSQGEARGDRRRR